MRRFLRHSRLRRFVPLAIAALAACSDAAGPPDGPQPPGQIVVRTQPTTSVVGVAVPQQVVVELQDCWDRLVDTTGVLVTASIASGTATIQSGAEAISNHGVATFENLVIVGRTTAPVVLRFSIRHRSGVGTTTRSSSPILLTAGKAVGVVVRDQASYTGNVGTTVSPAPSVTVVDAGQNPIAGIPVTFSVLQGAGRLVDSVTTSDANGIARLGSWTLGLPGTNRVAAKINDTTGVTFTAAVTGTVGMLRLVVTGRPDAEAAPVRVTRTTIGSPVFDSLARVLDTLTLTGIPFGTYAVSGDSINRGSRIWLPRASYANLTVSTTSGPEVRLEYVESGRIEATVRGLPVANLPVPLTVVPQDTSFAGGVLTARNDAVTRFLLPIGQYEIVAPVQVINGSRYVPTPASQTIGVQGGDRTTPITIQYTIATGDLVITLAGLPTGATAQVDVSGPAGFRETVFMSGGRIYSGLDPGTYTVTVAPVTVGSQTFTPTPTSRTVEVTAGGSVTASFTFSP
jgi:hypothetical protein